MEAFSVSFGSRKRFLSFQASGVGVFPRWRSFITRPVNRSCRMFPETAQKSPLPRSAHDAACCHLFSAKAFWFRQLFQRGRKHSGSRNRHGLSHQPPATLMTSCNLIIRLCRSGAHFQEQHCQAKFLYRALHENKTAATVVVIVVSTLLSLTSAL